MGRSPFHPPHPMRADGHNMEDNATCVIGNEVMRPATRREEWTAPAGLQGAASTHHHPANGPSFRCHTMERSGTVMVVDDDEAIREALSDLLEDEGYEVVCVKNGKEALEALGSMPHPGVLLLDLMMPVMSGWEVLEVMQEDVLLADIPVVVVSAMCAPGAREFIQKPIDLSQLLDVVHKFCG
jgi:two-component system response regulator CpxR